MRWGKRYGGRELPVARVQAKLRGKGIHSKSMHMIIDFMYAIKNNTQLPVQLQKKTPSMPTTPVNTISLINKQPASQHLVKACSTERNAEAPPVQSYLI